MPEFVDDSNYVGLNWFIDAFIGINTNGLNFNEIMLIVSVTKTPKSNPVLPRNHAGARNANTLHQFVDAMKIDIVSQLFARVMP